MSKGHLVAFLLSLGWKTAKPNVSAPLRFVCKNGNTCTVINKKQSP